MDDGRQQQAAHENEPTDTLHISYIIHFFLGAGSLVPWNSFITAVDYFQYLYPDKHVDKVFSVTCMVSAMLAVVFLVCLSNKKMLPDFKIRMILAQVLYIVALITPLLIERISNQKETGVTFAVLVLALVVCGLADGLTMGSLMGDTGKLPRRYMQATIAGNSLSGILVCILRIVTKASLPHSERGLRLSTRIYFIFSTGMVFLCLICYCFRHKLAVVKYYKQKPSTIANSTPTHTFSTSSEQMSPKLWDVKSIRHAIIGIFIIYTVTLSIFPGYLSENVRSKFFSDWYPILLMTTYNVGDFLGKMSTALYVPNSISKTMWICMARLGFYPLFAACLFGPRWLRSEVPVIFLTATLGLTNGFLTSVLMILGPRSVPAQLSERVAIVMSLFSLIGLSCGSFLGWLWNI